MDSISKSTAESQSSVDGSKSKEKNFRSAQLTNLTLSLGAELAACTRELQHKALVAERQGQTLEAQQQYTAEVERELDALRT